MKEETAALEGLVAEELDRTPRAAALPLVAEMRRRLGDRLAAVIFYGSCLRKSTDEGVLDFYAIVDDYRGAHGSVAAALANALYPPSVFYIEVDAAEAADRGAGSNGRETLRAKYAVMSTRDLFRAASPGGLRTGHDACHVFESAGFKQAPSFVVGGVDDVVTEGLHGITRRLPGQRGDKHLRRTDDATGGCAA